MPWCLEDEGFYTGKPPPVGRAQLSVMENRILLASEEVCQ